jgi:predicted dehydrogenase
MPEIAGLLRVGVVGTGAFGRNHARVYRDLAADSARNVQLTGIVDADGPRARTVAGEFGTQAFTSLPELVAAGVDAVSVAVPTVAHLAVARELMQAGVDVLIEKPLAASLTEADELQDLAKKYNRIVQVGHLERFNPAVRATLPLLTKPMFFEVHRLSVFTPRSLDVDVVLDLMIHDIDIVLTLAKSPVVSVEGVGIPVLSKSEDIANARIRFANGCIANITASRISPERMRKIRVFSGPTHPCYISLDYRLQEGFIYRIAGDEVEASSLLKKIMAAKLGIGKDSAIVSEFAGKKIVREPVPINKDEPLKLELQSFVRCVQEKQMPVVSGEAGKRALDLAFEITRQIQNQKA